MTDGHFWTKVDRRGADECWLWLASTVDGHGVYTFNGPDGRTSTTAHRYAYVLTQGPVAAGLDLDHLCRVWACCNPAHLEPVTHAENLRRSPLWGGNKTHCPAGHAYDETNTYVNPRGARECRACRRVRAA